MRNQLITSFSQNVFFMSTVQQSYTHEKTATCIAETSFKFPKQLLVLLKKQAGLQLCTWLASSAIRAVQTLKREECLREHSVY